MILMPRKSLQLSIKKPKIIYCEGESEESYFKMLRKRYRSNNVEIISLGRGQNGCVIGAISHIKTNKKENFEKYIVFDADAMTNNQIDQCFNLCKKNNINILFSNVCFEVWILSHYIKLNTDQKCTKAWLYSLLESKMNIKSYPNFKGNDYSPYIQDNIQQACSNVEKLSKEYREQGVVDLRYHNPFTFISDEVLKSIFDTDVL